VIFEKLVQILVFGCAYWRIAGESCSATTLRRRRDEWIASGVMDELREMTLEAYDKFIGLRLAEVAVDADGLPLGAITAPANRHDSPLLDETLHTLELLGPLPEQMSVHLERGYDSETTRQKLKIRGMASMISEKGKPAPLQATKRWVVERTNSWHNAHKKLLWCTERWGPVIDFWMAFSEVVIIMRRLIRRSWTHYRWETRPTHRP
jgi:IS5 family transposase